VNAVVFAYSDMGITGLNALEAAGFGIRTILSHEDDPGENVWFGSVRAWGEERGIPVLCPVSVGAPEWRERIAALAPEAIFSFYYRHMIRPGILDLAAGSLQSSRVAAPGLPGPRAGELGPGQRRDPHRGHAPPHGGEARRG